MEKKKNKLDSKSNSSLTICELYDRNRWRATCLILLTTAFTTIYVQSERAIGKTLNRL